MAYCVWLARRTALASFALVALQAAPDRVHAQQRPDFSGRWEPELAADRRAPSVATRGDASFETGDMGAALGSAAPVTITQRADSLVIEYVFFAPYDLQPPVRLAYALNGSESRNALMIGHAEVVQRARTNWRGAALAIESSYPAPPGVAAGEATMRQTLSLDASGRLVIETVRGGAPGRGNTTRLVYRKHGERPSRQK